MPSTDQIILVTGASSGMGRATALYLAKEGAKAITLFARRKEVLEEVAKEIEETYPKTKTLVVAGDASKAADNKRAVDETVKAFGGITSAFINAGAYKGGTTIEGVSDEDIDTILDLNVKGVLYAMRYLLPAIKETIGEEGAAGSIVVNSSAMGSNVIGPKSAGSAVYAASKAFVNSLVESAAVENAPRIRVNGVLPGVVRTNIMPGVDDDTYDAIGAKLQPLWGLAGRSDEIASLVAYLLSNKASFISGANIKADGLWSLSGGSF